MARLTSYEYQQASTGGSNPGSANAAERRVEDAKKAGLSVAQNIRRERQAEEARRAARGSRIGQPRLPDQKAIADANQRARDALFRQEASAAEERRRSQISKVFGDNGDYDPYNRWAALSNPDVAKSLNNQFKTRERMDSKLNIFKSAIDEQKKDPTTPIEERQALEQLGRDFKSWMGGDIVVDPVVRQINNLGVLAKFRRLQSEWREKLNKQQQQYVEGQELEEGGNTGGFLLPGGSQMPATGGLGDIQTQFRSFGQATGTGALPSFVLSRDDNGFMRVLDVATFIHGKIADARKDPKQAAALITAMAYAQVYGGGKEQYAAQRLVFDKNGQPIAGQISQEDRAALVNLTRLVVEAQTVGSATPIEDEIAEMASLGASIQNSPGNGGSGGGGGGGRRGGGGGGGYGGGGGGAVITTDPALLRSLIDGVARARMGRALTNEESAQFIAMYHNLETTFRTAAMNGQATTNLDPESQAVAWIESRMTQEAAGQQSGKFIFALQQLLSGGGLGKS